LLWNLLYFGLDLVYVFEAFLMLGHGELEIKEVY